MHNEAAIPNPALQPLSVLIGTWKTTGTHPLVPNQTFHGRSSFKWIEGGAFLMMHSEIDEPEIPSGIGIIGSDDATGELFMLYFDERGVSRKYGFAIDNGRWEWWRNSERFSQRFVGVVAEDGQSMTSKGEMRRKGSAWEPDLELTYQRIQESR